MLLILTMTNYTLLLICVIRINLLKQEIERKENEALTHRPVVSKHSNKLLKHRNELNEGVTVITCISRLTYILDDYSVIYDIG
jgi:hypothetical protein